jgi:hypothetical protein
MACIDLANRCDDFLLDRIPRGIGYVVWFVENFVVDEVGALFKVLGQLRPYWQEHLANCWIGGRIYVKGVIV